MNECLTKALDLKSILPNGKFILKNYSYDYSRAAEPPVRCGESHLSGLTEPPSLSIF